MITDGILADELRRHHLFAGLDDAQLARMIKSAHVVHLEEGQYLFECQQEARKFFLLRSGRIKLFLCSAEGTEKVVHLVSPGETFAEAIMFMDSASYPLNASAIVASELIAFSNADFRAILRDSVETCFRLLADMSAWLKKQLNDIDALALQNATLRFSNYLLQRIPPEDAPAAAVDLEAPKNVIASRLSIQPESFSRILRNMQRDGLITVKGNRVVVNDVRGLRTQCTLTT